MIRTRDVVVSMVVFMCLVLVAIAVVPQEHRAKQGDSNTDITANSILTSPRESYPVLPSTNGATDDERDSFIEKVRNTYPVPEETHKAEEVIRSAQVETHEVVPTEIASSTYGDTRF